MSRIVGKADVGPLVTLLLCQSEESVSLSRA